MIIVSASVRYGNTDSIQAEHPPGWTFQADLGFPVPTSASQVSGRAFVDLRLFTISVQEGKSSVATETETVIRVPGAAEGVDGEAKPIFPKISPIRALLTPDSLPLGAEHINVCHIPPHLHTASRLQLVPCVASYTLPTVFPYPTLRMHRLAHSLPIKVPPLSTASTLPPSEAPTPSVDWLGQLPDNTLAAVDLIPQIAVLTNADGSVEFGTLRGNLFAHTHFIKEIVLGALQTLIILPSPTTQVVVESVQKVPISREDRSGGWWGEVVGEGRPQDGEN